MHENRETSEIPTAKPGSRTAGEGSGHTARMHVSEESDSGAVPMNHSNKDEKLLAESEEGRPLIKENILQPSTHSTQSEARVSQGLAGVRKAATTAIACDPGEDSLDDSRLLSIRLKSGLASACANRDIPVSEWSTGRDIQRAALCGMPLTAPTTLHEFGSLIFGNDALHLEQKVVFRAFAE